jgi:hypothetical protein
LGFFFCSNCLTRHLVHIWEYSTFYFWVIFKSVFTLKKH